MRVVLTEWLGQDLDPFGIALTLGARIHRMRTAPTIIPRNLSCGAVKAAFAL